MKIGRLIAWATAATFVLPAFLAAQSLGDAAAKEKEKKKDAKAKVYTEDDLKRAGSSGTYSAPPGPDATASAAPKDGAAAKPEGAAKGKTDDELKADKQADWHKRLETAQQSVAQIQKAIDDLQASLAQSQSYYSPSRARAVSDLDEAKAKLEKAQQSVTDLEEEGRRNGFH